VSVAGHWAVAIAVATAAVAAIDAIPQPEIPPRFDEIVYQKMADGALFREQKLAAPFVYRPAVPWLAHAFSVATGTSPNGAFEILARVAAGLQLLLVFGIARSMGGGLRGSLTALLAVALAYHHVRHPLLAASLVDVEAYCVLLAASWALWMRRPGAALLLACVGLLFKEFLVIPGAIAVWHWARGREQPLLHGVLGGLALLAAVAIPRVFASVEVSFEMVELLDPNTWGSFLSVPLQWGRSANLALAAVAYGLPVWVLLTSERARWLWRELGSLRVPFALHVAGVGLLALYGGTNLAVFVAYAVPVLAVVLARLAREAENWEIGFALLATAVFNRIWMTVPVPGDDEASLFAYVDFYGAWAGRVTPATFTRWAELVALTSIPFAVRSGRARAQRA
jgi:hypothetical protein